MNLKQFFEVEAPAADVWTTLLDVQRVARCLPGADIAEASDEGTYRGTFHVKLGPATATYQGELHMESVDDDARVATMRAEGTDKRGQGSARASITSRVHEDGAATRVEVETDLTITGRLARFGRTGMIEDISNRLMREFADCLQRQLTAPAAEAAEAGAGDASEAPRREAAAGAPQPAKPIGGLRLLVGALLDRLRRTLRRPG